MMRNSHRILSKERRKILHFSSVINTIINRTNMPIIVGKSKRVVETDGFTIDEYAGNIGSNDDQMSLAVVKVSKPYEEPWLTLQYDEWMAVMKGQVDCHVIDEETQKEIKAVSAVAGDTIFIAKGQRFKPVFPVADTEYIPVCIPAFTPDRCVREEEDTHNSKDKDEEKRITERLSKLHQEGRKGNNTNNGNTFETPTSTSTTTTGENCFLYHMCEKSLWELAINSDNAYFPPTFTKDGGFTHATSKANKLIETANHFYTSSQDDWICLQLCDAKTLKNKCGIVTVFEEPKPVGSTAVREEWKKDSKKEEETAALFPHIYGGIPVSVPGIVIGTYPMERDSTNGTFVRIIGLTQ